MYVLHVDVMYLSAYSGHVNPFMHSQVPTYVYARMIKIQARYTSYRISVLRSIALFQVHQFHTNTLKSQPHVRYYTNTYI